MNCNYLLFIISEISLIGMNTLFLLEHFISFYFYLFEAIKPFMKVFSFY